VIWLDNCGELIGCRLLVVIISELWEGEVTGAVGFKEAREAEGRKEVMGTRPKQSVYKTVQDIFIFIFG